MSENHVMSSMSAPHLAEQIREDHIPWLRPLDRFSPFFGVKLTVDPATEDGRSVRGLKS